MNTLLDSDLDSRCDTTTNWRRLFENPQDSITGGLSGSIECTFECHIGRAGWLLATSLARTTPFGEFVGIILEFLLSLDEQFEMVSPPLPIQLQLAQAANDGRVWVEESVSHILRYTEILKAQGGARTLQIDG